MNGLETIAKELHEFKNIQKPYDFIKISLDWFNSFYDGEWDFDSRTLKKEELESMQLLGLPFKVDNEVETYELVLKEK